MRPGIQHVKCIFSPLFHYPCLERGEIYQRASSLVATPAIKKNSEEGGGGYNWIRGIGLNWR